MKQLDEPEAMREIHKIRRKQYEETKNMTHAEHLAYIKRKAKELEDETGIVLPRISKTVT